jgi:hypothetical protein
MATGMLKKIDWIVRIKSGQPVHRGWPVDEKLITLAVFARPPCSLQARRKAETSLVTEVATLVV